MPKIELTVDEVFKAAALEHARKKRKKLAVWVRELIEKELGVQSDVKNPQDNLRQYKKTK